MIFIEKNNKNLTIIKDNNIHRYLLNMRINTGSEMVRYLIINIYIYIYIKNEK